jgi:dTDP-4-amino-4,6-dideoxygalactose transaminase
LIVPAITITSIPFNKPSLTGRELQYAAEAILNLHTAADGPFTKRCQVLLETTLGAVKVLLTSSCTDALEMAAMLIDIEPGDEVIVPSYTFVSTANAFALRGARLVFADIRPDTLNLDERQLEALISPRTKAIVPMHYAGVGCNMEPILTLAGRNEIRVVEDNAHGLYARHNGRFLGTFGSLATQSFHETKNIMCGEGGALVINDSAFIERAEVLRDKGTNRRRFLRGQVDKYTWVDIGSSFGMSDLLAAFLYAQLEQREQIFSRRRAVWERYDQSLAAWAGKHGVKHPSVPASAEQSYHMYYLILPSLEDRQRFTAHLAARGILGVFHYTPLHSSAMGLSFGASPGQCPVTNWVSDRLIRLPLFNDMTPEDQTQVVEAIHSFEC